MLAGATTPFAIVLLPMPNTFALRDFAAKRDRNGFDTSETMQFEDPNPRHCYSFKVRVYPNGQSDYKGKLSVYFCPQPGPNPDALTWPINRTIRFTVINIKDPQKHMTEELSPSTSDGSQQFFAEHAPPVEGNGSAYGFGAFLSVEQIEDFLSNDTLFVLLELGPEERRLTDAPHMMQLNPVLWETRLVATETPVQKNRDNVSHKNNLADSDASCWQKCTSPAASNITNVGSNAPDVVRKLGKLRKLVIMPRPYAPHGARFAKERTPDAGRAPDISRPTTGYSAFSGARCRVQNHNGEIEDASLLFTFYHDHPSSNLHLQQTYHHIAASPTKVATNKVVDTPDMDSAAHERQNQCPDIESLQAATSTETPIVGYVRFSDDDGKYVMFCVKYKWEKSDKGIQQAWLDYSQFKKLWHLLKNTKGYFWIPDESFIGSKEIVEINFPRADTDYPMLVARHRRSKTARLLYQALIEHAIYLGMDPKTDEKHFHIAQKSLEAEVPEPWQQGITEEGDPYYYNTETEESVWKHPMEEFYREMFATAKASELNASKLPLSSRCPTF